MKMVITLLMACASMMGQTHGKVLPIAIDGSIAQIHAAGSEMRKAWAEVEARRPERIPMDTERSRAIAEIELSRQARNRYLAAKQNYFQLHANRLIEIANRLSGAQGPLATPDLEAMEGTLGEQLRELQKRLTELQKRGATAAPEATQVRAQISAVEQVLRGIKSVRRAKKDFDPSAASAQRHLEQVTAQLDKTADALTGIADRAKNNRQFWQQHHDSLIERFAKLPKPIGQARGKETPDEQP